MRSEELGVRSLEFGVWSLELGIWSLEFGVKMTPTIKGWSLNEISILSVYFPHQGR